MIETTYTAKFILLSKRLSDIFINSIPRGQLQNKETFSFPIFWITILATFIIIPMKFAQAAVQGQFPLCNPFGEFYDPVQNQCRSCHSSCISSWCIDETENGCLECKQGVGPLTKKYRVLGNATQWQCVTKCSNDQIPMSVFRPQFKYNEGVLYYCRTPEIYVDADSNQSNLELGTKNMPYRSLDDGFRELFNRDQIYAKDGSYYNVTVYLKGSGYSKGKVWPYSKDQPQNLIVDSNLTIYSLLQPIVIVNMNITLKPYYEYEVLNSNNLYTQIQITNEPQPRPKQNFNPTWIHQGEIKDYDYDRLIALRVLEPVNKLQTKYKITTYNSSLTVKNFYFNEVSGMEFNIDSLFRTYLSPYKWLTLSSCIFDLKNLLSFTQEGMNNHWTNLTINVSRSNQVGQLFSIADCDYYRREGIANNQVFDNVKYVGHNLGSSYYRIVILRMPQNVTFSNSQYIDVVWEPLNFGLCTGYLYNNDCPEITNFHVIHENSTFINRSPLTGVIPIQIFSDFVMKTVNITAIMRNNVFINQTVVPIGMIYLNFQLTSYQITMIMENNYFENVIHTGSTQISTVHAVAIDVIIRNTTFKNCNLAMGMMIRAKSAYIEKVRFINIVGGCKSNFLNLNFYRCCKFFHSNLKFSKVHNKRPIVHKCDFQWNESSSSNCFKRNSNSRFEYQQFFSIYQSSIIFLRCARFIYHKFLNSKYQLDLNSQRQVDSKEKIELMHLMIVIR